MYPLHVKTPHSNGTDLKRWTPEVEDPLKMLGVYQYRDASKSEHAKEMIKKGIDWVDRIK